MDELRRRAAGRRRCCRDGIRDGEPVRALLRRAAADWSSRPSLCPLPALEMLIAEMLAIHFCSDRDETIGRAGGAARAKLTGAIAAGQGVLPADAVRVFWVNPVADLRAMNLLEDCGGRVCGTDYLFSPRAGRDSGGCAADGGAGAHGAGRPDGRPRRDRADADLRDDAREFGAEAVIVSRIPGASHCATEGGDHRRDRRGAAGTAGGGDRSAADHGSMEPALRHADRGAGGDRAGDGESMICAGIDAGSRAIKIVADGCRAAARSLASGVADQGVRPGRAGRGRFCDSCSARHGIHRRRRAADRRHGLRPQHDRAWRMTTITEITCHAVGVRHRLPGRPHDRSTSAGRTAS